MNLLFHQYSNGFANGSRNRKAVGAIYFGRVDQSSAVRDAKTGGSHNWPIQAFHPRPALLVDGL